MWTRPKFCPSYSANAWRRCSVLCGSPDKVLCAFSQHMCQRKKTVDRNKTPTVLLLFASPHSGTFACRCLFVVPGTKPKWQTAFHWSTSSSVGIRAIRRVCCYTGNGRRRWTLTSSWWQRVLFLAFCLLGWSMPVASSRTIYRRTGVCFAVIALPVCVIYHARWHSVSVG